jgi:MFS family permease
MNPVFIYVVVGALLAWRIYRRIRRNIGRQKLRPRRIITSLVLFGVISFFIIFAGLQYPLVLAGYAGGILGGAALGFVGLKLTQFETTEEGHFYTPDTRIGVAISLLLTGRIIYRFAVLSTASIAPNHPPPMQSPLTFLIIGLTAGYYIVYYIGLFVHTHDKTPATATSASSSSIPPVL